MEPFGVQVMVEQVRQRLHPYPLQPPCSEAELTSLRERVNRDLLAEAPEGYYDLLRTSDGFEVNALDVFGSRVQRNVLSDSIGRDVFIRGFVEENQEYRANVDNYDQLLVFASREGYVYAKIIDTGEFIKLLETESQPRKYYATFDEMIVDAVQNALAR